MEYLDQEKDLNVKILKVARDEEEEWRVKSRKLWLKGGDINTEYFHKQAKARLSFNITKEMKYNHKSKIKGQENIKKTCSSTL